MNMTEEVSMGPSPRLARSEGRILRTAVLFAPQSIYKDFERLCRKEIASPIFRRTLLRGPDHFILPDWWCVYFVALLYITSTWAFVLGLGPTDSCVMAVKKPFSKTILQEDLHRRRLQMVLRSAHLHTPPRLSHWSELHASDGCR